MNLTRKQFTKRFVKIFGELPNRWMIERKAQAVHKEITSTKKSFKQIRWKTVLIRTRYSFAFVKKNSEKRLPNYGKMRSKGKKVRRK